MRLAFALALVLTSMLVVSRARAQDDYPVFVVPGVLHSFVGGDSPAAGNGVELSTVIGTDTSATRAAEEVGVFTQLESLSGDHGRSTRWALGAQASVLGLGFEAGYAMRTADDAHAITRGLHLAPFFSLGYFSIAYRWTLAVGHGEGTHGLQYGVVLALKLPLAARGAVRDFVDLPFSGNGPITFGN